MNIQWSVQNIILILGELCGLGLRIWWTGKWFGRLEQGMMNIREALDRSTIRTDKLESRQDVTETRVNDHETRITVLEKK